MLHLNILSSALWFQGADTASASASDVHLLMIFIGVIAVCFVLVLLGALGALIAVARLKTIVTKIVEDATKKATPAINSATALFNELTPNVRKIAANTAAITDTVKGKVDQIDDTISDVNHRTKAQVARVDGFVSETLDTTADIASSIQRGVRVPLREISGIMAGMKAAVDVLAGRGSASHGRSATRPVEYEALPRSAENVASVTPISPRREATTDLPVDTGKVRGL